VGDGAVGRLTYPNAGRAVVKPTAIGDLVMGYVYVGSFTGDGIFCRHMGVVDSGNFTVGYAVFPSGLANAYGTGGAECKAAVIYSAIPAVTTEPKGIAA
jgi:hypothetical protein